MKSNEGVFSGRYWLPLFGFGAVIFLGLSMFWGYQLWESTKRDAENIQKIREFQTLSKNVLFFSRKTVTGDPSAIDALVSTVDTMNNTIEFLLLADDYTKDQLANEFESAVNFWRSIRNNAAIISEIEYAIALINATADKLDVTATESQKIIAGSIEQAIVKRASKEQVAAISEQSILLRRMAINMKRFAGEVKSTSRLFDTYRSNLVAFDKGSVALLNGDATKKIKALNDSDLRADIESLDGLIKGVYVAEAYIVNSVEGLLLARDAHSKVSSSFEGLQLTLDEMRVKLEDLAETRFPQPIYVAITLIAFILCIVGFAFSQKQSSREIIAMEQSENENVQAAILRLLDELADLADGDLTVTTTVSEDFTGAIADSVNYTIDQLRQLVSRINKTAVQVSAAAQDSQQTALHLAEASDHQAQEIAGASAAINEMAVTIDQVSANAAESALVASKSVSIANNGAKLVQNTIHGMDTIREQIQDTSKRIKRLGESSQEIGDIVSLINDIADQTNILALNAAIQASMAGDAGRGFAVVADEVQRLAERSASATKQIESLVKTIQTDTNEAVSSMEQTTTEVVSGARLAQDAGVALEEIEGVSANIAELIQNISNAARQQASSAGHISNTMNVIQEITSQTSAGTGATAQAIGDLADMALELRESVAGFTLPDDMEIETNAEIDTDAWLSADDLDTPNASADAGVAAISSGASLPEDDMAVNTEEELARLFDSSEDFEDIESADLLAGFETEESDVSAESPEVADDFDFSEEMFDLANSEGVDLLGDEFDPADFDFTDEKEKDSVS
jgi:twitching motility protein PilJ